MSVLTEKQQRRRANERSFRGLRRLWAKVKAIRPGKDPAYLAWLHTLPCAVPNCSTHDARSFFSESLVEAAHVGDRGLRQKCSDREAIPLCGYHHRIGQASHHCAGKNFWRIWKLDRDALIAHYNALYEQETSCKSF